MNDNTFLNSVYLTNLKENEISRENAIHDWIINSRDIQKSISEILGLESVEDVNFVHEDRYINGITADFTLLYQNSIRAIIECKAGDIGVTEFVRGIGQVLQYEFFWEQKISKGKPYSNEFNSILLFPSTILKSNLLNIGRFKYPDSTILIEVNVVNKNIRNIDKKELDRLGKALDNNLATISQYYIRDNRLYEIYMLLKLLNFLKIKGELKINRKEIEEKYLKKLLTQNNNNWRNAFITLSSLGLINNNNLPTNSGIMLGNQEYEDFLLFIYKGYISQYIDLLLEYFKTEENLLKSNSDICKDIKRQFDNKDVLFLTESNSRYMSSWLNILRDDYGVLNFLTRDKDRKLNYIINELNEQAIKSKIKQYSKGYSYISNFNSILK